MSEEQKQHAQPRAKLSVADAVAMIVGIVIGVGIFKAPSIVAGNVSSDTVFLLLWLAGGIVSLIGALCYAELGSAFPHAGGEYFFLNRAYGHRLGFMFAWARMSVIQTGAIAAIGEDIIDLGMGNPDQPTPKHIVDKLIEASLNPRKHRYSASRGIYKLRSAIADWYKRSYNVDIDPETEAVATIGSKEGIAHLAMAIIGPGDVAFVPSPTYPIHTYSVIIAGGDVRSIPLLPGVDFFDELQKAMKQTWPRPKLIILNFPHNPTTECVDREFFVKIVDFAKENDLMVVHDLAYADIVFDGYKAPSFLEIPGAKDVGVEFFTLSKSYNMPGWRVGFAVGNKRLIGALTR